MNLSRRFKQAIKVWELIAAHRSTMVVTASLALHWQRVERFPKFATRWDIATSARPVFICMPLMTARWDRFSTDAGCDSDRVVTYEICHRDSSLRDQAGFESVETLIDT